MKVYTEKQVKSLLEIQRGNCYVAILSATNDKEIAGLATQAPLPGGEDFSKYYGIDVESLFKEDLEDRQLQRNFESFKQNRESAKKSYNATVPEINLIIDKIFNLRELIVTLSIQGLSTKDAVNSLAILDADFTKFSEKSNKCKEELDKQDDLIKKYEDWNERKLFIHWNYLTHLKVTNEPWMDWKKQYTDVMI